MADPFQIQGLGPGGIQPTRSPDASGKTTPLPGQDFQSYLLDSLEKVNSMSKEANEAVERLATGQTQNVAEVFTTVQKAGIAFDLLMEIRNKMLDAYQEIRQMQM
jgi:flagellar hook-basal body complex protein FliE